MLACHNELQCKIKKNTIKLTIKSNVNISLFFSFLFFLAQNDSNNLNAPTESVSNSNQNFRLMELSFEYLMAKNTLQWITIISEQAMLMSVCLQSIVDELLNQKDGNELNRFEVHYFSFCLYFVQ